MVMNIHIYGTFEKESQWRGASGRSGTDLVLSPPAGDFILKVIFRRTATHTGTTLIPIGSQTSVLQCDYRVLLATGFRQIWVGVCVGLTRHSVRLTLTRHTSQTAAARERGGEERVGEGGEASTG